MKPDHTPPPWILTDTGHIYGKAKEPGNQMFTSGYVCTIDKSVRSSAMSPASEEDTANAALITAAPDLLQVAEKLQDFLNNLGRDNRGWLGKLVIDDFQSFNEAMIELPAAIKKAKGVQ